MRKELLRATREQFRARLASEFPRFNRAADAKLGPAIDLYVMRVAEDLFFFIVLVPNTKASKDSFMVELGWAKSDRPARANITGKADRTPMEDGNIRLPYLWRREWRSALEPWWEAGNSLGLENMNVFYSNEEIQRRLGTIPSLVEDAVARIKKYGIPLFQTIAAARGHSEAKL